MSIFSPDLFLNPPSEFRPLQIIHGMDRFLLDPENLNGVEGIDRHLEKLIDMGTGGVVTNVGFQDYLQNPRQWDIFRHGVQKAQQLGMVLWLYDEKGYPSGTAGGIVTRSHPEFAVLGLAAYSQ
ncbi:MAG TPA: hypothetical protein VHV83_22000, partial [Armatimonadota bacterium]|nr:hypothetical protein [Armatimonadota bacterium]